MITQGELRNQLEYDETSGFWRWRDPTARVNRKEGWFKGAPMANGYRCIRIDGKTYYAHTLAWLYVYGEYVTELDHRNRNKEENWIENLRMSSKSTNAVNAKLRDDNSTGHVGISQLKGDRRKKWFAYINKDGTRTTKTFLTFEEAVAWRKKMQEELFGEFVPKLVSTSDSK